ncbi:MAG: Sapep family Mn(2+)-dependent dipeptidase, partial [Culicoidibacterales bacterium]
MGLNELITDAIEILRYPSIFDDSNPAYPFGQANYECLVAFCELCEQAGLQVHLDESKKFAFADTPGPITYGVLGHLDVVDVGDREQWLYDPFGGTIIDNKLYGRGAQDMKVPMVVILHVLKDLMASGHEFTKGIRFIIGSDEECGFECMHEYARKFEFPPYGFTPDGEFGIGNIETSLIEYDVYGAEILDFTITGGVGYNTVPDRVTYQGPKITEITQVLTDHGVKFTIESDCLHVFGQAIHVCEIERGENAIQNLIVALYTVGIHSQITDYVYAGFGQTTNSAAINGVVADKFCGNLASNVGIIDVRNGSQRIAVDLRIPILTDEKLLLQLHENFAQQFDLRFTVFFNDRKIYVDPNSEFLQTLQTSYESMTNLSCDYIASRGGSYAKVANNYVSFGALLKDQGEKSTVHQVNEHYDLKYLETIYTIYYTCLSKL